MQFTAAILALAAAVSAAPDLSARGWCTFGEYDCSKDGRSIKQCDISGNWVVSPKPPFSSSPCSSEHLTNSPP